MVLSNHSEIRNKSNKNVRRTTIFKYPCFRIPLTLFSLIYQHHYTYNSWDPALCTTKWKSVQFLDSHFYLVIYGHIFIIYQFDFDRSSRDGVQEAIKNQQPKLLENSLSARRKYSSRLLEFSRALLQRNPQYV